MCREIPDTMIVKDRVHKKKKCETVSLSSITVVSPSTYRTLIPIVITWFSSCDLLHSNSVQVCDVKNVSPWSERIKLSIENSYNFHQKPINMHDHATNNAFFLLQMHHE